LVRVHCASRRFDAIDVGRLYRGTAKDTDLNYDNAVDVDDYDEQHDCDVGDQVDDYDGDIVIDDSRVLFELSPGPLRFYRLTTPNVVLPDRNLPAPAFMPGTLEALGDILASDTLVPDDAGQVYITGVDCEQLPYPLLVPKPSIPTPSSLSTARDSLWSLQKGARGVHTSSRPSTT
jgi:hypothetical protein